MNGYAQRFYALKNVQRIFENVQQIFGVTMHTYHTLIEHPNHQIGYISMTKTVKGTMVNSH